MNRPSLPPHTPTGGDFALKYLKKGANIGENGQSAPAGLGRISSAPSPLEMVVSTCLTVAGLDWLISNVADLE